MSRVQATLLGTVAILMWSLLAVLTAWTGKVPALQLTAFSFGLGFLLALGKWLWRRESILAHLAIPRAAWLVGVGGLFGYHALYFLALRLAPPVEASLLNYLWPLLIVLFSSLLPGEHLRPHHLLGALAGLAGTVLLVAGSGVDFASDGAVGYAAALACAFIWSGYSVLSRRMAAVPTDSVGGFCLATALLALLLHLGLEDTVWPQTAFQWFALFALGLGPAGSAFFFWDVGMKRGDIRALGVAAYATPLLSTSWLLLVGFGQVTWSVVAAAVLITGGGLLGARDLLKR